MTRDRENALREELKKAQQIKQQLENLQNLRDSYPEGHHMYEVIAPMHVDRALQVVEEEIAALNRSLGGGIS